MDAMSSEDSCYEDDENGNPKVAKYAVRKLPWESGAMKKIKKKLDKAYRKRLSKRAKERIVTRTEAEELSERQPPNARNRKLTACSMFPTGPTRAVVSTI